VSKKNRFLLTPSKQSRQLPSSRKREFSLHQFHPAFPRRPRVILIFSGRVGFNFTEIFYPTFFRTFFFYYSRRTLYVYIYIYTATRRDIWDWRRRDNGYMLPLQRPCRTRGRRRWLICFSTPLYTNVNWMIDGFPSLYYNEARTRLVRKLSLTLIPGHRARRAFRGMLI